jgi:hypothetical protein
MDWNAAVQAVIDDHASRCPDAANGHDWQFCALTVPVPEMARTMGLLEVVVTIADRERERPEVPDRPDLDDTFCECGQSRRGHSVDGSRCYHCSDCQAAGGWRERGKPETWGQRRGGLSLSPDATGQAFGEPVARPEWFRHGD